MRRNGSGRRHSTALKARRLPGTGPPLALARQALARRWHWPGPVPGPALGRARHWAGPVALRFARCAVRVIAPTLASASPARHAPQCVVCQRPPARAWIVRYARTMAMHTRRYSSAGLRPPARADDYGRATSSLSVRRRADRPPRRVPRLRSFAVRRLSSVPSELRTYSRTTGSTAHRSAHTPRDAKPSLAAPVGFRCLQSAQLRTGTGGGGRTATIGTPTCRRVRAT